MASFQVSVDHKFGDRQESRMSFRYGCAQATGTVGPLSEGVGRQAAARTDSREPNRIGSGANLVGAGASANGRRTAQIDRDSAPTAEGSARA